MLVCLAEAKVGNKGVAGPSLLEGNFNEDDSHASFADALSSWRGKGPPAAAALPTSGPDAAPGEAPAGHYAEHHAVSIILFVEIRLCKLP